MFRSLFSTFQDSLFRSWPSDPQTILKLLTLTYFLTGLPLYKNETRNFPLMITWLHLRLQGSWCTIAEVYKPQFLEVGSAGTPWDPGFVIRSDRKACGLESRSPLQYELCTQFYASTSSTLHWIGSCLIGFIAAVFVNLFIRVSRSVKCLLRLIFNGYTMKFPVF